MRRGATFLSVMTVLVTIVAACSSGDDAIPLGTRPADTEAPATTGGTDAGSLPAGGSSLPATTPAPTGATADVTVQVDGSQRGAAISPLILGLSSTLTAEQFADLGTTLNSWGGNPATRFNYMIGHAWNHGSDYEFRNTDYQTGDTDAARDVLTTNAAAGVQTRLAVPTLGWVAKDDDQNTCSFPDGSGGCRAAGYVGNCSGDGPVADPNLANVPSDETGVAEWVRGLVADGFDLDIIAMDNEPELWGTTHYDVHPVCPTYEEILDKYLTYADVLRDIAPDSLLAGPVMCCWYDYWDTAPGPADGPNEDFLGWFLRNVKAHDDSVGHRSLDIVDVHYYPQSDVFNDDSDESTNLRRIRSTRSLWDPTYNDESWIDDTIEFIPRIKAIVEESYPGTPILVSEWNFGSEATMNGAVAIAEVLGIYGREGVTAAAYWRNPPVDSPGWFAFKMHGNYDDQGSRFGGDVVPTESSDPDAISAYTAVDEAAGIVRMMVINKDPATDLTVGVGIAGLGVDPAARTFSYGPASPTGIVTGTADVGAPLVVPASSITVIEMDLV